MMAIFGKKEDEQSHELMKRYGFYENWAEDHRVYWERWHRDEEKRSKAIDDGSGAALGNDQAPGDS